MIHISDLPALNATFNGISAVFLASGYLFIINRRVFWHRLCMIAAFLASSAFLISYVTYHFHVGNVKFHGTGWIRPVYFSILISHTILAAIIVPLVVITLFRALRSNFEKHKKLARWTLPMWFYVSVTGVVIYWMLYRL